MEIINYFDGMEITTPCAIRNMPIDVYHRAPALSNSGLKILLDCPAKYYYKYLSGEYEPKEKPSFKIGKAAHCYLLEGKEAFEKIYWHNPYSEYKKEDLVKILEAGGYSKSISKCSVAELNEFLMNEAGIEPKEIHLSSSELNQIVCMARSANADPEVKNALSQKGESEISLFWEDEKTGVILKCRPDYLPYDCLNVPDYKTSDTANPREFLKKFVSYGYHVQAAMYKMGIKAVFDVDVENFFFLVQEKEPPYVSQIFNPSPQWLTWGEKAIYNAIEKYKECQETGIWGTYTDKIIELSIEPPPDDILGAYDAENAICYAPSWVDRELERYEI